MKDQMPAKVAPVPGLRTTRVLLLLPLVALLYFAGWNHAGNAQTSAIPSYDHIFFVIDENHSRTQVIGPAPYLSGLARAGAQSNAYSAVSSPSLPNYLALTDGTTHGVTDDGTGYVFNTNNIAHEITTSGRTWKGYMEDLPSPCNNTGGSGGYAKKHNPFMYQSNILNVPSECNRVVPYTQLATDLRSASTTPNFVWITPNLCNDMHDCSVATGDNWANANFPAIFNSPAWKTQKSLFVFTIDEGGSSLPFFAMSSDGSTKTNYVSTIPGTHYSWLRTIEAAWSLAQMTSNDAAASPMTDLFTGSAPPSPSPPPTTGVLSGTVTNAASGAPVPGATVNDSGGTSTITNALGGYSLPGLTPGTHTVTAVATGFRAATQTASVTAGTTSSANFSLSPIPTTGAIAGFVINVSSAAAIAGATVSDSGGASAATDATGAYTLSGLSAGSHTLTASATGFNPQTKSASVTAGQTIVNVSFSLVPLLTTGGISGTVTNTIGGVAIAGATVSDSGGASAATDASGAYTLSGLSVGSHTLTASATGFTPQTKSASVTAGQTTVNVGFSLAPLLTTGGISGTVTSTIGGVAIAGATVRDRGGASAITDRSGFYSLPALPPGNHRLTASLTGFTSLTQTASVNAGTTSKVNFSLTPAPRTGAVAGSVSNASSGAAIVGATVTDSGGRSATTDASGAYTLLGLSARSHTLTAAAAGFSVQTQSVSVTAGTTLNFSFSLTPLPTTGAITGAVTNTEDGAALVGAAVTDPVGASAITDAAGAYTISGLAPGSHTVTATATGFTPRTQSVSVTAGSTTQNVSFSLAPISSDRPALVQASGATESSASNSLTATFPSTTSRGHLLVLSASIYAGTTNRITSVTDPAGNAWTRMGAFAVAGHYSDGEMWYATAAAATTSATVQLAKPAIAAVAIQEFSGVAASSPPNASTGASSKDSSPNSGSLTGTNGDLLVGYIAGHTNSQAISVIAAGFGGHSQQTSRSVGSAAASVVMGFKVLTSNSNEAYTGSVSSAMYWAAGIATFKASAISPTTGALGGTVTDASTGAAIAGATVTESGGVAASTDALGAYTLAGLAPGNHTLTASATGFIGSSRAASVVAGSTTQNISFRLTPSPSPDSANGPIRAAFLYDWYPETWRQGSHYAPAAGLYASANPATLQAQVASMLYAKITTGINSWFGPRTLTDSRIDAQLAADHGTAFTTALYYEPEAYSDPSPAQISSDMAYAARYFTDPSYLHINGKPVVFVYADGADNCGMAQRWAQGTSGKNIYVVLKVFRGYLGCASQPSSWHQYSGGREDRQGSFSTTIAPSFWKWGEAAPRLSRDPVAFAAAVRDMVASGAQWQLIVSYNEYVEGTQIEATTDMPPCAGHGIFLTILHRDGNPGPC